MIRGIHHVAIHVKDLERMVQFYKDAFGFEQIGTEISWKDSPVTDIIVGLKNSAARTVMLRAGTCYFEVFEYQAPAPREAGAAVASDRGYTHFCVDVTNIDEEMDRLSKLGMRFFQNPAVDLGFVKTIYGQDPEGNLIEVQETRSDCAFELGTLHTTR